MKTFKLSPSSLNLLKECPRCFWLDKHGIWKRPSGIFPSLPNGMDSILKSHFDKFRDRGMLPPEINEHHHTKGLKLFGDNEEEKETLRGWRNNLKGIRWTDSNGNILFGAVDNILTNGKKLIVLDYKTKGFPIKDETESGDYYQNQLDFYNFLLKKNGYDVEDYAFLLFYVPSRVLETGEVIFDTLLARREVNMNNAKNIFERAISMLNKECPEERCQWCECVDD